MARLQRVCGFEKCPEILKFSCPENNCFTAPRPVNTRFNGQFPGQPVYKPCRTVKSSRRIFLQREKTAVAAVVKCGTIRRAPLRSDLRRRRTIPDVLFCEGRFQSQIMYDTNSNATRFGTR